MVKDKEPREKTTIVNGEDRSQISPNEDGVDVCKDDTTQACIYKPLLSPLLRQRKKPISMFEIQPIVSEDILVQEMCIEAGAQQDVKENVTTLPKLISGVQISDEMKLPPDMHNARSVITTTDNQPEVNLN